MFNPFKKNDPKRTYDPFSHLKGEALKEKAKKNAEEEQRRREEGPCRPTCWDWR